MVALLLHIICLSCLENVENFRWNRPSRLNNFHQENWKIVQFFSLKNIHLKIEDRGEMIIKSRQSMRKSREDCLPILKFISCLFIILLPTFFRSKYLDDFTENLNETIYSFFFLALCLTDIEWYLRRMASNNILSWLNKT